MVLDASAWINVLAGWLTMPELAAAARTIPPHFDAEVVGGIRSMTQRKLIDVEAAEAALGTHLRAPFERVFDRRDIERAWQLREAMSFADAWYVALAERLDATFITADERAARAAMRYVQVAVVTSEQPSVTQHRRPSSANPAGI